MSQKNMGRLAQDMKREVIAIIGRLKDPRLEGGKMNRAAHEAGDMVKLIELEGEEKLFYPAFPIDIAVIRATYADERGNCTFEREGVYAEALAHAKALGGDADEATTGDHVPCEGVQAPTM